MDLQPPALYGALWIPAAGIKAPLVKPATYVDHGISGAWEFSNGTDDTIVANMRIPYRMNRKIAPSFSVGWCADGISPGNCKWQIEYLWVALDEDTTAAAEDTVSVVTAASVVSNGMILSTAAILKSSLIDVCLHTRIKRMAADAEDTIADTTELMGICLNFNLLEWEK